MSEHCKSQLPLYVNGSLPESTRRQVDEHLATCEKCRHLLTKFKSKEARQKREALKSAGHEQVPNMLQNRIRREAGMNAESQKSGKGWFVFLLLLGITIYFGLKKEAPPMVSSVQLKEEVAEPAAPATAPTASSDSVKATSSSASSISSEPAVIIPPSLEAPVLRWRQWKGAFCPIKDYREVVITDKEAWRDLWHEMNGADSKTPRIEFSSQTVVGIFLGTKTVPGYEISIHHPQENQDVVIVPYSISEPVVSSMTASTPIITQPYHLKTIPRFSKKIIFRKEIAK